MTPASTRGCIVVGVNGSPGSTAALRFAFDEGLERDADIRVITTWTRGLPRRTIATAAAYNDESAEARRIQDAAIAGVLNDMRDHPEFTQVVINDLSGPPLTAAARNASMLVIGTGRESAQSSAFLGSVSEFCVRHSTVPVVVVPDPSGSAPGPVRLTGSRVPATAERSQSRHDASLW